MKKFIVPLLAAVMVVSIVFAGCMPAAAPPVTPPPVAPPVTPPPVAPPEAPEVTPPIPNPTGPDEPPKGHPGNPFEGLGIKPDGTPYKWVYNTNFLLVPFHAMTSLCTEAYLIKAGSELLAIQDANMVMDKVITDLEDVIAAGEADVVIICAVDSAASVPIVERVIESGIDVVAYGSDIPAADVISCGWHDYTAMGALTGQCLVDEAEKLGKPVICYEIVGHPGDDSWVRRHTGFRSVVDPHPDLITVFESPSTGWSAAQAQTFVTDVFAVHPDWNAIMVPGDLSDGPYEALKTIGRLYPVGDPNHVITVAMDVGPRAAEIIEEGCWDAIVEHSPWEETDLAIKAYFLHLLGKPVNRYYNGRLYIVNQENVDNPMLWAYWVGRDPADVPILDLSDIIPTPYKGMP
ncbi:hypothetical protein ES703_73953 [subsurface metagenome]